jgi:hypothetical protein
MVTSKLILGPSGIAGGGIITVKDIKDTNFITGEVIIRRPIPVCMPCSKMFIKTY